MRPGKTFSLRPRGKPGGGGPDLPGVAPGSSEAGKVTSWLA